MSDILAIGTRVGSDGSSMEFYDKASGAAVFALRSGKVVDMNGAAASGPVSANVSANGALPMSGTVLMANANGSTYTLALPVAGAPSAGGQDGLSLQLTDTIGVAHTVTLPSNGFVWKNNQTIHIATFFTGNVAGTLELVAFNGKWYAQIIGPVTFS